MLDLSLQTELSHNVWNLYITILAKKHFVTCVHVLCQGKWTSPLKVKLAYIIYHVGSVFSWWNLFHGTVFHFAIPFLKKKLQLIIYAAIYVHWGNDWWPADQSHHPWQRVEIFNVGVSRHFIQKYMFLRIISLLQHNGIQVRWHFFLTDHDNRAVDGVGCTMKRTTPSLSSRTSLMKLNAADFKTVHERFQAFHNDITTILHETRLTSHKRDCLNYLLYK